MRTRPSLTVITIDGHRYDANHLSIERDSTDWTKYKLTFLCSGARIELSADRLLKIEYEAVGATWCSECDQPILLE